MLIQPAGCCCSYATAAQSTTRTAGDIPAGGSSRVSSHTTRRIRTVQNGQSRVQLLLRGDFSCGATTAGQDEVQCNEGAAMLFVDAALISELDLTQPFSLVFPRFINSAQHPALCL